MDIGSPNSYLLRSDLWLLSYYIYAVSPSITPSFATPSILYQKGATQSLQSFLMPPNHPRNVTASKPMFRKYLFNA